VSDEIWKDVVGYEGLYEVSSWGRIRDDRGLYQLFSLMTIGYYRVALKGVGNSERFLVHRLVLIAFEGLREGFECSHKDGIKTNNILSNLKWETHKENMSRTVGHGTSGRGGDNGMSKLTEAQVLEIKELLKGDLFQREIGARFGVSHSTIGDILHKRTWRYL